MAWPAILAVLLLALLAAFRAGLLIACRQDIRGVPAGEIANCLLAGLRFDVATVCIPFMPLATFAVILPAAALRRPHIRQALSAYLAISVALAVFIEIAGACFFEQFATRLNWMAIEYLQHPDEILAYLWAEYSLGWVLLGIAALQVAVYCAAVRFVTRRPAPWNSLWVRMTMAAVAIGAGVVGVRGGVQHDPLSVAAAETSVNNVIRQLTPNSIYSLIDSVRSYWHDQDDEDRHYPFPPVQEAARVTKAMLWQASDVDLGDPMNPLWRRTRTGRPLRDYNVVLILMEGMSGSPVGALGYSPSQTPFLDSLCRAGVFFDRFYATGSRTNRAIVATLCGHPSLGGSSILTRPRSQGRFMGLPGILRDRGYKTFLTYGGQGDWDNIRGFFTVAGIDEFMTQDQGLPVVEAGVFGVPDSVTLTEAHKKFVRSGDRRFFATIVTVSNHEPFDTPTTALPPALRASPGTGKSLAYRYADWALEEFFRQAREADYFRRTIFVLVGDHGRDMHPSLPLDVEGYRVPCLIYAPSIVDPQVISTVASQVDLPTTILSLLGGEFDHCFMGRDLLAVDPRDGFALLRWHSTFGFVSGSQAAIVKPNSPPLLLKLHASDSPPSRPEESLASLSTRMFSYYTTARDLYWNARYCPPAQRRPSDGRQ